MKRPVCALVFCGALLWSSAVLPAADFTVDRSFPAAPGGKLVVKTDFGRISLRGGAYEAVDILVSYSGQDSQRVQDALQLEFDSRRNEVRVTLDMGSSSWWSGWFGWSKRRLEFDISVPEQFDADLKTSGGSIEVDNLRGRLEASTSGGSLRFGEIYGPIRGRTSGGSVKLGRSTGDADLSTSGGSISIGQAEGRVSARTSGGSIRIEQSLGPVEAHTSGGGIHVEEVMGAINASTSGGGITAHISRQPEADCRLSTSGGSVEVYLNSTLRLDLDARSSGGRVSTELETSSRSETSKSRLTAELNGGGPRLVLRTSGGPIRIRSGQ